MSNVIEFQLLKVEGDWPSQTLGCFISIDNRLLDVITPLNSKQDENIVDLPELGKLRLTIKDMSNADNYFSSVSLSVLKLPENSTIWLPLFDNPKEDYIEKIPQVALKPRILIKIDNVIKESMEATMPFIALCTKNIHFEEIQESHELNESILSSNKSSDAFYHDSEISMIENPDKFKTLYKKQLALTQEISNQLNLCKIQLKFEIDRKEGQENRFVKAQQEFEEARKRFQNRENSVLKLMDSKDNEINEALNEITRLKALNRALEGDKKQFTDFSSKIQAEITSVKYNELKQELLMTKTSLEISEKRRAELQKELESIGTEWEQNCEIENDSNKELEKANQDLKEEIEKLKSANHTLDAEVSSLTANKQKSPDLDQEITVLRTENTVLAEENEGLIGNVIKLQEQMKVLSSRLTVMDGEKQVLTSGLIEAQSQLNIIQSSFLHLLIQDTLRKFNFQGNFTKIQNNLYSINSKEFYLQAHNNQVVVKIGASLVPLEEFLQLSHPTDRTLSFENEESISSHHILTFFSPPSSNSNTPRTTYDRKSSISTVETFKNNENEVKSKSPLSSRFIKPTISSQYKTRISLDKSPLQPRNSKSAERKRPFK